MATTAMAISNEQLGADLRRLKNEAAEIQKKLDGDSSKLAGARAEHQRLVAKIASGAAESDVLQRVKGEMETLAIRIDGHNDQFRTNRTKAEELEKESYRRQGVAANAAREKEFTEQNAAGIAIANKILELLTQLVTVDVPAFDALRRKLGTDFRDMGGETAALRLREMLWKAPGYNEKLHDPNVHLRRLFDQGWAFLGETGPHYQSVQTELGGFESVPGGDLILKVCSLRPKK